MYRVNLHDICARNQLNAMADILERDLINAMAQFDGKKVWKISGYGGLTAAAANALNAAIDAHGLGFASGLTATFFGHGRGIFCTLRLRYETEQGHSDYAEESFRIGRRDNDGFLCDLEQEVSFPEGRPRFTQRQVEFTLKAADSLEAQALDLRSALSCFQR